MTFGLFEFDVLFFVRANTELAYFEIKLTYFSISIVYDRINCRVEPAQPNCNIEQSIKRRWRLPLITRPKKHAIFLLT